MNSGLYILQGALDVNIFSCGVLRTLKMPLLFSY